MTDVSPTRRRLGRWLLAGGALALPLTASVSYAASSDVEQVAVPPSAAPAAPEPPAPPVAPDAPLPPSPPEAPQPPDPAVAPAPHVQTFVLRHGDDGKHPGHEKGEKHVFVMQTDGPLTPEQQKHFENMRKEWEKKGEEWQKQGAQWQKQAGDWQKYAEQQRQFALAHVPDVSTDCDNAGSEGTRSWTDGSGRQHVVVCERIIRDRAQMAPGHAMMSLRMARSAVANNDAISDSVKAEVLRDLDKEISRLDAEQK